MRKFKIEMILRYLKGLLEKVCYKKPLRSRSLHQCNQASSVIDRRYTPGIVFVLCQYGNTQK